MAQILKTFDDLIDHCREQLGVQESDTTAVNKIKRALNHFYINEVIPFKRWNWLTKHTKIIHKQFYTGGTASVTPDSATVTLSVAPSSAIGSLTNYYFAVDGFDEVYTISAHTSESTTVTLSSTFQGTVNTAAAFAVWTDRIALPADCREVFEMWHNRLPTTMEGKGHKEFLQLRNMGPRASGLPQAFYVGDYFDPSGGSETETDRYRVANIWPAYTDQNVTISVDYAQEVDALDATTDEPVMPIEDRNVLVHGALSELWRTIARNPEEAANSFQLYQNKLSRMAGKIENGFDAPILTPKSSYLRSKRASRIGTLSNRAFGDGAIGMGSSSYSAPTYLANVTINGATITGNVTVSSGITIDGVDISVLSSDLTAHIADTSTHGTSGNILGDTDTQTVTNKTLAVASNNITSTTNRVAQYNSSTGNLEAADITGTELTYLNDVEGLSSVSLTDNTTNGTALSFAHASFDVVYVEYSIKRGAGNVEAGVLVLGTDGTNTSLGQTVYSTLGTLGTTFNSTISGANVLLRYTTTSTGTGVTMKYKLSKRQA